MKSLTDSFFKFLQVAIAIGLAIMMVLVFFNVVLRYAFNLGITVSEEVSRFIFVWLTFLGAIVALKENGHLGVDSLVKRLPLTVKKICFIASRLLMLYVTWLFLDGSWQQTVISYEVNAILPVTGLSMTMFYGVGIVFSLISGVILGMDLYKVLSGKISEKDLVSIKESSDEIDTEFNQKNDH